MRKVLSESFLAICLLAVISCGKEKKNSGTDETIAVTPAELMAKAEGETFSLDVRSNGDWTVSVPDWLRAEPLTGSGDVTVSVAVSGYSGESAREAEITFSMPKGAVSIVKLTQFPPQNTEIKIKFTNFWMDLARGETTKMTCEIYGKDYDPSKEYPIRYTSSNPAVAFVSDDGTVKAQALGQTVITATLPNGEKAERTYYVPDYSIVAMSFDPLRDYFSCHKIQFNSVMQSWDFFDDCLYFAQLNSKTHQVCITRATRNKKNSYMNLYYAGHGDNICVERSDDGNDYIWVNNYGTIDFGDANHRYYNSQTVCRVAFQAGKDLIPSEISDHYYWKKGSESLIRISPSLDTDNNLLCLYGRSSSTGKYKIMAFDLTQAKALTPSSFTLSSITYGGDSNNKSPQKTETPTIQARNLAELTPVFDFEIPYWDGKQHIIQGFDFHHGKLYYLYGNGDDSGKCNNSCNFYATDTEKILAQHSVPWVKDMSVIKPYAGLGYWEPEGVKIKEGVIYLGFAGIQDKGNLTKGDRLANIFAYKL